MSYDWKKAAEQEAPESEPLPAGEHVVRVERVIFGYRDGEAFTSRSGDPQIMLVFADGDGREAASMYTLSDRAAWALAKVLTAGGADVERMTAKGIEPGRFVDPRFAEAQLVGRELRIEVSYEERDGRRYAKVRPVDKGGDDGPRPRSGPGMGRPGQVTDSPRQPVAGAVNERSARPPQRSGEGDLDQALGRPGEPRRQVGVAVGAEDSPVDREVDDIPF